MEGLGRFAGARLDGLGARRTRPGGRRAGGPGSGQSGWAERRQGPPEPPLLLSSGCGGDRSARVTGGLPSVWELPLQLLWQPGPNPTLFTSCEEIPNGWGALSINGLLPQPPPQRRGWAVRELGEGRMGEFPFLPPSGSPGPSSSGGWGGEGLFGGEWHRHLTRAASSCVSSAGLGLVSSSLLPLQILFFHLWSHTLQTPLLFL